MRTLALLLTLAAPAAAADPFDWLDGTWQVSYPDAVLGEVKGYAIVTKPESPTAGLPRDVHVTLRDPRTGAVHALRARELRLHGQELRLRLRGTSPSGVAASGAPAPSGATVLRVPSGTAVTAEIGKASASVRSGELPSAEHDLTLTVGIPTMSHASWRWSYPFPGDPPGMAGRRAGQVANREVAGYETWRRGEPYIASVQALDFSADAIVPPEKRRDMDEAGGEDAGTALWLRLEGTSLPVAEGDPLTVRFDDTSVLYTRRARRTPAAPGGRDALELRVVLLKDVEEGPKTFTVNGLPATWDLRFPGPEPDVQIERWVGRWEATQVLTWGQIFRVRLAYPREPFFDARQVALSVGARTAGPFRAEKDGATLATVNFAAGPARQGQEGPPVPVKPAPEDPDVYLPAFPGQTATVRLAHLSDAPALARAEVVRPAPTKPEVVVVGADQSDAVESGLTSLSAGTPFKVAVRLPAAQARTAGERIQVNFAAERTRTSASWTLESDGSRSETVTYRVGPHGYLADHRLYYDLAVSRDLGALSWRDDDVITVSYGEAHAKVRLYASPVQQRLHRARRELDARKALYRAMLANYEAMRADLGRFLAENIDLIEEADVSPPVLRDPSSDKRALDHLARLAENGLAFMAMNRFTDPTRVMFGEGYLATLDRPEQISLWRFENSAQLGVTTIAREESELVLLILREAEQARTDRFHRLIADSVIGAYEVLSVATGASQVLSLFGSDHMGRKLEVYQRVLAGIQLAELFVFAKVAMDAARWKNIRAGGAPTPERFGQWKVPSRFQKAALRVNGAHRTGRVLFEGLWVTREQAAAAMAPRRAAYAARRAQLAGMTVRQLETEVVRRLPDVDARNAALYRLHELIPDAAAREVFMRTPGSDHVLAEVVGGGNKEIGATYIARRLGEMARQGRAMRVLEDYMPGGPRYEHEFGRQVSQASDSVASNGDVIQGKSYKDWSKVFANTKEQVLSDLTRYADQNWTDSTGEPLSLRFEYHIDRSRLGGTPKTQARRDATAAAYSRDVSEWANRTLARPDGKSIQIVVTID